MNYKKINKNTAKRLYDAGFTIFLKPCNIPLTPNMWFSPMALNKEDRAGQEQDFKKIINCYTYYNCNNEMGRTLHYFIEEAV